MKSQLLIPAFCLLTILCCKKAPGPTPMPASYPFGTTSPCTAYTDVSYVTDPLNLLCGVTNEKQAFDLYVPQTSLAGNAPKPLVIFVHGGSFTGGDKQDIATNALLAPEVKKILDKGWAFATLNYRLLGDCASETCGIRDKCMDDVVRCLKFIKSKAGEYDIDKSRIGMFGVSAGATTSLWIALKGFESKAVPTIFDPVLDAEATDIKAVFTLLAQSTLDLEQWDTQVFTPEYGAYDLSLTALMNILTVSPNECYIHRLHGQGNNYPAPLTLAGTLAYRADMEIFTLLANMPSYPDPVIPVLFLRNDNGIYLPLSPDAGDINHHPLHAVKLVDVAQANAYPADKLYYFVPNMVPSDYELAAGLGSVADFFLATL